MDYQSIAKEHNRVVMQFFNRYAEAMHVLTHHLVEVFGRGNKVLFCGNGGSACDSMHIAGEFVGRFKLERKGLPSIALSADSGIITAVANDYAYETIFARQVEALGNEGDVLIGLSTSGSSPNVLKAFEAASEQGLSTVLFTGRRGEFRSQMVNHCFVVDSHDTARIQECYMVALHSLAEGVENQLASA